MKEALKLALEALEYWDVHGKLHQPTEEAITALRLAIDVQNMASESTYKAALAQPAQQEPVAVVETLGGYPDESRHEAKWLVPYRALKEGDNLYTTPQPAQEPEIYSRWQETIAGIPVIFESEADANRFMEYHFANAGKPIEQPAPVPVVRERPSFAEWTSDHVRDSLHKLKPAQQEPTGMLHIDRLEKWLDASLKERKSRRTWVGLTDEERNAIFELHHTRLGGWDYSGDEVMYDEHFEDAVATIEAKLKEKNT